MPLPLLANPWTLSIIGGLLPSVASAVLGSKSKEDAQAILAPKRHQMVAALIAEGADPSEAEQQADAALEGELLGKMQEGALPGWAEVGLGAVGGGIGGLVGSVAKKGGMAGVKSLFGMGKKADDLVPPFPGQRPPPAAVTRETPDADFMRRRRDSNDEYARRAQAGEFDDVNKYRPAAPGEERGVALRDLDTVTVDEIIPPFPTMRGQSSRFRDADYEMVTPPPRAIGSRRPEALEYREPVGSAPAPSPMSPRDEFRRELASDVRSQPNTPPIVRRRGPLAIGYDPESDAARLMREYPELF